MGTSLFGSEHFSSIDQCEGEYDIMDEIENDVDFGPEELGNRGHTGSPCEYCEIFPLIVKILKHRHLGK